MLVVADLGWAVEESTAGGRVSVAVGWAAVAEAAWVWVVEGTGRVAAVGSELEARVETAATAVARAAGAGTVGAYLALEAYTAVGLWAVAYTAGGWRVEWGAALGVAKEGVKLAVAEKAAVERGFCWRRTRVGCFQRRCRH